MHNFLVKEKEKGDSVEGGGQKNREREHSHNFLRPPAQLWSK